MASAFLRVGLTGGIASGKSTVAALLKKHGIAVVDLDTIGRSIVDEDPKLAPRIADICGAKVLKDGALDRRALKEHLFGHPADRGRVEKLLHPIIWEKFEKEARALEAAGRKIIVCEAALLLEAGLEKHLGELIVVLSPTELRLKRLLSRDGIDTGLAAQMIAAQVDDVRRRKAATHLIDNQGDVAVLASQVAGIVEKWKKRGLL
jgi:dephospho-CoA kinase